MGQTHLHTDTESHQHAQMLCEEKSNTNSVGCVLCGSCGESVTYLFSLKMISPFPSPSLFCDVSEGWRCRGKEIKTFFLTAPWRYGRCAERAEFSQNAVAVALFMALCAPIICVCTPHCSQLPPRTHLCMCVCVCVCVCACVGGWVCVWSRGTKINACVCYVNKCVVAHVCII